MNSISVQVVVCPAHYVQAVVCRINQEAVETSKSGQVVVSSRREQAVESSRIVVCLCRTWSSGRAVKSQITGSLVRSIVYT